MGNIPQFGDRMVKKKGKVDPLKKKRRPASGRHPDRTD
jgi:hypothetical protein